MNQIFLIITLLINVILFQTQGIAQWIKANGIEYGNTYGINNNGTNLFAAVYGQGIFISNDNGDNWTKVDSSLVDAFSLANIGSTIFAGNSSVPVRSVFRSTNNGANWTNILTTLYGPYFGVIGSTLFAGSCGGGPIRRSMDYGDNWEPVNNGITQSSVTNFGTFNSEIFAATDYGHLFRSIDLGDHWTETAYSGNTILSIHKNENALFVGTQTEGDIHGSVYYSTDDGQNWTNTGLDNYLGIFSCNITSILSVGDKIFVGTNGYGVFLYMNDGSGWTNVGLDNLAAWQLIIIDDELIAGTSSGVWKRPLSEMITSVENQISNTISIYTLRQNYPNPYNSSTIIKYSIPKEGLVTLKVYNILGEEVADIVNELKLAGNYEVTFNSDNLTSGVYLYKFTAGNFVQTRKMILLK